MKNIAKIALVVTLICYSTEASLCAQDDDPGQGNLLMEALGNASFADGTAEEALSQLQGKEIIALYFTAKWCAPCRTFTPKLVKFRNENSENFQFVMMSWDKSIGEQRKYLEKAKMMVPAVRFDDPFVKAATQKFAVNGVPTLLVFDADGVLLTGGGREHLTLPVHPEDLEALGAGEGAKCWREMIAPLQKELGLARDKELAELAPVFEKYSHFPQLDAIRAVYGYYGKNREIDAAVAQLGREIAADWEGKKGLLDELPMLASELKPDRKGYRGILEVRGGRCFDELGKAAVEIPAILTKLYTMIEGGSSDVRAWAMSGIVNAAVAGSEDAYAKVADYKNSFRVSNAPLRIFPALKPACRSGNEQALKLAHKVYQSEPYYVYAAFPAFVPAALEGNQTALDAMSEIAACGKEDYEQEARKVISEAADRGSEYARKLLEGLKAAGGEAAEDKK